MKPTNPKALSVILAVLSLTACTRSVTIVHPTDSTSGGQIIDKFKIVFHARANKTPGTSFKAFLDGVKQPDAFFAPDLVADPTGQTFTATVTPGSLSPFESIHRLRVEAEMSPSQAFDSNSSQVDFIQATLNVREQVITGPWATGPATNSGTGGGAAPLPGFFLNLSGPRSGPRTILVGSTAVAANAIPVTIHPTTVNVSVSPSIATIASGTSGTSFTLTGLTPGPFTVEVTAPGFQPSGISGTVVP